ncbi:hypothetical protein AMS58_04495 [Pseudoalteromonas porphyrae]|uniref:MMPL family transporter n=1 Tax=Pseudoalteromonas TaxID=53246 RepID=UPI0006BA9D45|nr:MULTISPECIES: MMPL family transporter [Pseudoalteromonas]KPH95939.1 hypothetical protein AMS58_04495 [Pseudoalteromonas porphyrae]
MPSNSPIKSISSRTKLVLWLIQLLLLIAGLIYLCLFKSFSVVADINQIFTVEQSDDIRVVSERIEQQHLRQHVLLVAHEKRDNAIEYAEQAAASLRTINGITVNLKFGSLPQLDAIVKDYLPYQHAFVSNAYKNVLSSGSADDVFTYQFSLLNEMGSPWVASTLEIDPSLSLADFFNQQNLPTTGLKNDQGYLIAQQTNQAGASIYYVLVNFVSAGTGLDLNIANDIATKIAELKQQNKEHTTGVHYLATGAAFFTANASNSAQTEMKVFGGISIIATLLLILAIYRSALSVLCTLFVISVSMLYGYSALRLFFTEVNILTLVFAVTLIGIAADYSFHALSELRFSKLNRSNPLLSIRSSLLLGFITTTAGYLILVFTPLSLFQQIAVFTMAGLLGALLTVLLVYPSLAGFIVKKPTAIPGFITRLNRWQKILVKKRVNGRWQIALLVLLLGGLSLVENVDDPRTFYQSSADLISQQQQITTILNAQWDSPYILIAGDTPEQTLQRSEQLIEPLTQLQQQGVLSAYASISQWLPSIATQIQSQQLVKNAQQSGLFEQLNTVLGLVVGSTPSDYKQLDFTTWQKSQVAALFNDQWLQINGRFYSIIKLKGINDSKEIDRILNNYSEVVFVDKVSAVGKQIGQFRHHLILIYALALIAAMLVFWLRYGVINAITAVSRPVIAMIIALAMSALFFGSLSVFNYVAGILILALGLDYCVFYAEHGHCEKITLTTLISALSSLLVFAILIVSSTPAVSQFGFTVFIGVVVVFTISPRLALVSKRNI